MISLGRCDIEVLLQATDDVAQRALTRFRRGCARVAAGHLPGGANAIVVICHDRDVHGAAARNSAKTKASSVFVFGSFSGFIFSDSSDMVLF